MSKLKKYLGLIWILLAFAAGYYLVVNQAWPKFQSEKPEDKIPAIIYAFILTPIIFGGFFTFGYFALNDEYSIKD